MSASRSAEGRRRQATAGPAERLPLRPMPRGTGRACTATTSAAAARLTPGTLGVAHKSLPCGTQGHAPPPRPHRARARDRPRPVRRRPRVRPDRGDGAQAALQRPRADPDHALDGPARRRTPFTCRVAPKRVIAHLDCDAFYATVELLRRPELRRQAGDRRRLRAARGRHDRVSYEARKFGVGSAMPASRARRLCPDGDRHPARLHGLPRDVASEVWELVGAAAGPRAADRARRGVRRPDRRREAAARAARARRRGQGARPGS